MRKSYKYRIYLTMAQQESLRHIFNSCRFLYNCALEARISYYKKYKKSLSYNTQASEIKGLKHILPEFEKIHSQTIQYVLKTLDLSTKQFFSRRKSGKAGGFPRFKSIDRFKSIMFPQCDFNTGGVRLINDKQIQVYGIDNPIRIRYHRPFMGRCKTVQIVKNAADEYHIVLSCDDAPKTPRKKTGKVAGIDFGIENFITLDDGTKFHHPKPYKTSKEKLAYLQRRRAASQPQSNINKKLKHRIAKLHQHIVNIREDFQHKLSTELVEKYDIIFMEDLNIDKMLTAKGYAVNKGNIMEAAWGGFAFKTGYKAESAGSLIGKLNPYNTSRKCSCCGHINESLKLSDRIFRCEACGFAMDRDQNAALNIRRAGTARMNEMEAPALKRG